MLSDSLELMHFLSRHGQDSKLIVPAVEMLDEFTDKWHHRASLLRRENVDEQALKDAVESALGEKPDHIEFQSRKALIVEPGQERGPKMVQQDRFYRIARAGNLARELRRSKRHERMYASIRNLMSEQIDSQEQPLNLRELVRLSLGVRTLQPALDDQFGNSIGRLVKRDFIELWYCRFGYVLLGEFGEAERLDPLIRISRTTPTLGRLQKKPFTWIFWED